jgi:pilus assembly protein CpaE
VKRLLEHLRDHYDFVIIDTSSSLDDVALAMLDVSDRIFLVTQQSLPALKNASRFFDLAETLDYSRDKVLLLVNRSSDRLGISVKDIANTLKRPVIATLPIDDEAVNRAIDEGKPLITGRHRRRPIATALNNLAGVTMTLFDQESGSDGAISSATSDGMPFWKRLLGRSSHAAS